MELWQEDESAVRLREALTHGETMRGEISSETLSLLM